MEPTPEQVVPVVAAGVGIVMLLFWLAFAVITIVACCKIFSKAGYSWALGLLMLIPIANLIVMLVLAFGDWPILKEMRALKAQPTQATE
ncbi:MAG: hypothetical protein KAJ07_00980 [Planctomycetes bacterium]|nr:hypothetical protein [Planctomycetota bacterium]